MNLHLLAGIPVLLILVAASAYREALRNEPIRRVASIRASCRSSARTKKRVREGLKRPAKYAGGIRQASKFFGIAGERFDFLK
jgi:hypothetical protein